MPHKPLNLDWEQWDLVGSNYGLFENTRPPQNLRSISTRTMISGMRISMRKTATSTLKKVV